MLGDPVFVGVTCMSGQQIGYGLEFARRVRAENPHCPIVWGGVHPTLLPEQTAANECVDVVVRGESELVVADLADRLAAGEPLDDVNGLTYKAQGEIVSTPDADLIDLDSIPLELPYDLLDLDSTPRCKQGASTCRPAAAAPTGAASATTASSTSADGAARAQTALWTRWSAYSSASRT